MEHMKTKKTTKRHSPGSETTARMVGEDQGRMAVGCNQFAGYLDGLDEEEAIETAVQAESDSRYYDGHPIEAVLALACSMDEEEKLEEAYDKGVEEGVKQALGANRRLPKQLGRKHNPKLEWGLQPPPSVEMAWGARTIYKPGEGRYAIDLLWDRQSMEGGTASERKALSHWINTKGLKAMRLLAPRNLGAKSGESVHWTDGKYMIEASPRESYGYLYIVAYPVPAGTSPEPKPPSNTEYVKAKRAAFRAAHGRRFNSRTTAIKKEDEVRIQGRNRLLFLAKVQGLDRPQPKAKRGRKTNSSRSQGMTRFDSASELRDMQILLGRRGYDPRHALALKDQGIGLTELYSRLRVPSGELGSLEYTHNIHKIKRRRRKKNPRGRCIQPRATKGLYGVCPKGTAAKPGKKCLQPRAAKGRFSTCK